MQEQPKWAKVNIYNIYLIFLNLVYWLLISVGVLWLFFIFITNIFILSAHNATPLNIFGFCALYVFVYICILSFVHFLKKFIKKLAKRKDGLGDTNEKINSKKEILFWIKIYFILLCITQVAIYSIPLSILVLKVLI